MRSEPCSAAWRLTALLLGASWVVTLGVACGGGGDDAIAGSVAATSATGGAGSGAPAESAAVPAATSQSQVLGHHAAALSATLLQPCVDDSRRPAHLAAVPEHLAGVPPHQRSTGAARRAQRRGAEFAVWTPKRRRGRVGAARRADRSEVGRAGCRAQVPVRPQSKELAWMPAVPPHHAVHPPPPGSCCSASGPPRMPARRAAGMPASCCPMQVRVSSGVPLSWPSLSAAPVGLQPTPAPPLAGCAERCNGAATPEVQHPGVDHRSEAAAALWVTRPPAHPHTGEQK